MPQMLMITQKYVIIGGSHLQQITWGSLVSNLYVSYFYSNVPNYIICALNSANHPH